MTKKIVFFFLSTLIMAKVVNAHSFDANIVISSLYKNIESQKSSSVIGKIKIFSQAFLNRPYLLGPLGEGPEGEIDPKPLYRADVFDCTTYVATVLALAQSHNLEEFNKTIRKVNYQHGEVSFVKRNHFITTDWNPANQHNGYIQDITYKIIDQKGRPVAEIAETIINKPGWYLKMAEAKADKAGKLKAFSKQVQQEKAVLLYIPFNILFDKKGQPNVFIFNQIPDGSIIEIVRPNWPLEKTIGTNLNVSHMGFAIRTKQGLMFREASSEYKKVIDIPLVDYLKPLLDSKTIKGIHIEMIT